MNNNNPFAASAITKKQFDWWFGPAELQESYSLQRYKELFLYFVNVLRSGKTEMLEQYLFDDTWGEDYNRQTSGSILFHLAVNCYLYYVGYRESEECVDTTLKTNACLLLKKICIHNHGYFRFVPMNMISEWQLQYFLREVELSSRKELGKVCILPDIVKDFYIFTLLVSSVRRGLDIKQELLKNGEKYGYRRYLEKEKEKKEFLKSFLQIFSYKTDDVDILYDRFRATVSSILAEQEQERAEKNLEEYNAKYSEEVLSEQYKKQINIFLQDTFGCFPKINGKKIDAKNEKLLSYRAVVGAIDKNFGQLSLDALLFNVVMKVIQILRKENVIIIERNLNLSDVSAYLDYLSSHNFNLLIGAQDRVTPQNYKEQSILDRYEKDFRHIYILGWYRNILALRNSSFSLSVDNIKVSFSVPTLDELQDEYVEKNGKYSRNGREAEFSKDEFASYVKNTYRNITITSDIIMSVSEKDAAGLIIPVEEEEK